MLPQMPLPGSPLTLNLPAVLLDLPDQIQMDVDGQPVYFDVLATRYLMSDLYKADPEFGRDDLDDVAKGERERRVISAFHQALKAKAAGMSLTQAWLLFNAVPAQFEILKKKLQSSLESPKLSGRSLSPQLGTPPTTELDLLSKSVEDWKQKNSLAPSDEPTSESPPATSVT